MNDRSIAYFSMEIALDPAMPTYSGGLGVLAGDTIRSAADLQIPFVAVSLVHRKGYFYQTLSPSGEQREAPVSWVLEDFLKEMPARTDVEIEGRTVKLRAWQYTVKGISGYTVPVYFLDSDLPENAEWDRTLTHYLYGGDTHYRLCQEIILGIGGVRMLRALGIKDTRRFHMNEGHASLLTLALMDEQAAAQDRSDISLGDVEAVRKLCVFTTHTPVPAGHDQFPMDLVNRVLDRHELTTMREVFLTDGTLNMTQLALNFSHYVNGVAKTHGEVSQRMFAHFKIDAITNGVHAATWAAKPIQDLFDRYISGWRQDNFSLRYALNIPKEELWQVHLSVKQRLFEYVNRLTNLGMDINVLTIGFARRAATYKRADLLFHDMARLKRIASKVGPVQILYSGKAHPQDQAGKDLIQRVFQAREALKPEIKLAYLENYDMDVAKGLTAGVDLWLNTPQPPLEASGTSGMKAALNGVPSFSVLDGWWFEGHIENVTGWSIGPPAGSADEDRLVKDAASLYDKLETVIVPMFYHHRGGYLNIMRHAIALNGSFFNTQRMLQQYVMKAYFI
jgi:glycogen phosphorylase